MSQRLLNCFWAAFLSDCYSLLPYFLYSFGLPFGVTAVARAVPVRSGAAELWVLGPVLGPALGWGAGAGSHPATPAAPCGSSGSASASEQVTLTSPKVKRS